MFALPRPDRFDLAALLAVVFLLVLGHVIYPVRLVTVSVWITNVTIFTCWIAYLLYRMAFDESTAAPVERDS